MGVSVRHNSRLAALVALVAAVMTVAWFSRALQTGSLFDWFWCVVVAAIGVVQLLVIRDGRAPLMVADEHGVRVRRGETWSGLRWQDIEHVEVQSPASWLRDGQIVVHPRAAGFEVIELAGDDEEPAHGIHQGGASTPGAEAYVVPLARTTRLDFDGLTGDLVADLDALASGRVPVLVLTRLEPAVEDAPVEELEDQPSSEAGHEPIEEADEADEADVEVETDLDDADEQEERASLSSTLRARWADRQGRRAAAQQEADSDALDEQADETDLDDNGEQDHTDDRVEADDHQEVPEVPEVPEVAGPTYAPVPPARETRPAARSEVLRDSVRRLPAAPAIPAQRAADGPVVVARVEDLDDFSASAPQPVEDPVIGPLVAAARQRARLSIDVLSERTRIRPHVLECIEVDDFEACGGDFYARGHLRTLARVFGLDAQQLVDLYDDRYAKAEIEARQVFEAELASGIGGGVRAAHTGPRWSLLAACVLALAGVWGVARVFNDTPQELVSPAPEVVDSAGLATSTTQKEPTSTLAPLAVKATGASPQVVVRDRDGRILWAGRLAEGKPQQVIGMAPFEVTASNGSAVKVSYLGKPKGTVGSSDAAGSRQFG